MAVSTKYGKVKIANVGEEEPVFILRAQDKLAAPTIEIYRTLAETHGSKLAGSLGREIENFRKWQGKRKLPD